MDFKSIALTTRPSQLYVRCLLFIDVYKTIVLFGISKQIVSYIIKHWYFLTITNIALDWYNTIKYFGEINFSFSHTCWEDVWLSVTTGLQYRDSHFSYFLSLFSSAVAYMLRLTCRLVDCVEQKPLFYDKSKCNNTWHVVHWLARVYCLSSCTVNMWSFVNQ